MKTQVNSEIVLRVAKMAQIELTSEELQEMERHFEQILSRFDKISEISTEGVEPLVTPSPIEFHDREDVVRDVLPQEESLKNAPERSGYLFKVPPIIG